MAFNSIWPLFFLVAIPIIIILYILKPKGTDVKISSNVLWRRLFRNNRSKTIFEKFIHEILMYLEIVTALLLVLALMSPYIKRGGTGATDVILVIDNSLSMQHKDGKGRTRLSLAQDAAMEYADSVSGTVTVISCSDSPEILVAKGTDKGRVKSAIAGIEASDREGSLSEAEGVIGTFDIDSIVVFSDGQGRPGADELHDIYGVEERFFGGSASNVSLDFVAVKETEEGLYDVSVRFTDFSESPVTLDVTLYDDKDKVLGIISKNAEAGKSGSVIFEGVETETKFVKAEISNMVFDGGLKDSLEVDNEGYAMVKTSGDMTGILIGEGNTFIERAYKAVAGKDLTRAANQGGVSSGNYDYVIFDAGFDSSDSTINYLAFGADGEEEISNVVVNVKDCELTEGIGNFKIGANKVSSFTVPDGAESFMEAGGKCVGYFGSVNGVRVVRVGFDIRETDFPVQAEFPVFMAHSMKFLSEQGLLAQNEYTAGEPVRLSPSADMDISGLKLSTDKAGIYAVETDEVTEYYVVKPNPDGTDGRVSADDVEGTFKGKSEVSRRNLRKILLAVAILLLIAEFLIFAKKMQYRGVFYTVLRVVIVLLVILSLIELKIPKRSKNITTVFLVDLSKSNEANREEMEKVLKTNLASLPKHNSYAIVTFGRNSVIDQFVTDENMFMGLEGVPDISATNFEDAMGRAVSLIPSDSGGRIVILSDGRETGGDIENVAAMIASSNVELDAIKYDVLVGNDAFVRNVEMPSVLHPDDKYYMNVEVESNYDTDATIAIYSGNTLVSREKVQLKKGGNSFVFEEKVTSEDIESFKVRVEATGDTVEENNDYSVYAEVESSPKVLVLYGNRENYSPYKQLLENINANATFENAKNAPTDLMGLLEYKAIIFENVYLSDIPNGFLENLETYVKDYGGGFAALGGEDSFMLGGYNDTVVESVLPVDMDLRGTAELPNTAIVMVIDHSGSMDERTGKGNTTYLDVAIESAKRGVDNLRSTDSVGVLAFDTEYKWFVKLQNVEDKAAIKDSIDRIPSGGGTTIQPAVNEACRTLAGYNSEIKHIILLTDGYGESDDYKQVVKNIKSAGITLSTVAVGEGSDQNLMKRLATQCNGRYYYADADTDLPRIFAEEVFLGGDTYIKNGDYPVSVATSHELTKGLFNDGWYNLAGYVASSQKTGATQVIATEDGDPILTVWQYGLGRTLAWNTDVDNGWTGNYAGESDYAEFHRRVIDYLTGSPSIGEDKVDVTTKNGKTDITYTTGDYGDDTEISAIYTSPDGSTGEVTLTAKKPGVYTASMTSDISGIYHINVRRTDGGEVTGTFTTASAMQYSDEYRFDITDENFSKFIDSYGNWLKPEDTVWKKLTVDVKRFYNLTDILLILGLILFILDVAGRRFGFEPVLPKFKKKETAGTNYAAGQGDAGMNNTATKASVKASKKSKKSKPNNVPEQLDTSALLQKKRDRNL